MVENLNYLISPLLLALFGLPAGFVPRMRGETAGVRFSMMFMAGVVVFVVWETLLSLLGIRWSMLTVAMPLGVLSVSGAVFASRRGATVTDGVAGSGWDVLTVFVAAGGVAHMVLSAATARATSIDFFYFWGVKGVEFARAGGIDVEYLASNFSVHAHTPYPPLVPLVMAWGVELAGTLPWRAGLVSTTMWLLLAYPVVLRGLRSRLPVGEATMASGVWFIGLSLAVTRSHSAGNAEPALLFFTTIALVALVAGEDVFPNWVAPLALCGVVLTKSEGVVLWVLLAAGAGLQGLLEKRPLSGILRQLSGIVIAPALALGSWIAFELRHGLTLSDSARESAGEISIENLVPAVVQSIRYLEAGSGWLAWTFAVVVIVLSWRAWRSVVPALAVTTGILGFLLVYYLHYQGESLETWVSWTLPRVSLTALSAALIAAAMASGREVPDRS